tara:strand:+ start:1525 stop:1968 length:444 start_codon:yes stop_codon:yes gene_type:complete
MKSLLSNAGNKAYKFYKDNETAIELATFLVPGGFLAKGALLGYKYTKAINKAEDVFNAANKKPKLEYVKNRNYSGNWLTQNRAKTQTNFFKNVESHNKKAKIFKKEQSLLTDKHMPEMLKNTGVGAGLGYLNLKRLQNNPDYKKRVK